MGSMAIGQLTAPANAFIGARVAASRVYETIERIPLIDGLSTEGLVPSLRAVGNITIQNVDFAYPTRPDVLVCNNYSLTINSGETVAMVSIRIGILFILLI